MGCLHWKILPPPVGAAPNSRAGIKIGDALKPWLKLATAIESG